MTASFRKPRTSDAQLAGLVGRGLVKNERRFRSVPRRGDSRTPARARESTPHAPRGAARTLSPSARAPRSSEVPRRRRRRRRRRRVASVASDLPPERLALPREADVRPRAMIPRRKVDRDAKLDELVDNRLLADLRRRVSARDRLSPVARCPPRVVVLVPRTSSKVNIDRLASPAPSTHDHPPAPASSAEQAPAAAERQEQERERRESERGRPHVHGASAGARVPERVDPAPRRGVSRESDDARAFAFVPPSADTTSGYSVSVPRPSRRVASRRVAHRPSPSLPAPPLADRLDRSTRRAVSSARSSA